MKNKTKASIIKWTSTGICVGAPFAATLAQFPVWIEQSAEATMSGLFLIFAFFSCLPFIRQIKEYMKSPAAWVLWLIVLISAIALRAIIEQVVFIAGIGFAANIVGMILFRISNYIAEKPDAGTTENQ